MKVKFVRRLGYTVAFLRMAAIELRRIAEREPSLAAELGHVARQLDLEAGELAEKIASAGRPAEAPR